jgi:hypothetical protein
VAEHLTPLDTLAAPSRTDLMVFCQVNTEKAVFAIEGKVNETFDDEICRWIRDARKADPVFLGLPINPRKKARLEFLNQLLDLNVGTESDLYYQLFHRTACALLEARSIYASTAFMVVQSFLRCEENWNAYQAFAAAMGFMHIVGDSFTEAKYLTKFTGIGLRLGWVYDATS